MGPRVKLASNQQPGADARGDGDIDQLTGAAAGPAPVLAEGGQLEDPAGYVKRANALMLGLVGN